MAVQRATPRDRDKDEVSRGASTYAGDTSDSGSSSHLKCAVGGREGPTPPRRRAPGLIGPKWARITRALRPGHRQDIHATEGMMLFEWAWPVLHYACRLGASQYILFVKAIALTFEGHAK
eukprot:2188109-Pyramimonas_sp.AAC.1